MTWKNEIAIHIARGPLGCKQSVSSENLALGAFKEITSFWIAGEALSMSQCACRPPGQGGKWGFLEPKNPSSINSSPCFSESR